MTQQTINHFSAPDSNGRAGRMQFKYVPAGTGPAYCGPGDQVRFLITGAETGGVFFMAEVTVPPGGGPPLHVHQREEESFHLLEGTLTIEAGGKTLNASSGDFVYLPRGMAHSFRNAGNVNAKFLLVVTPAGLENFFAEAFDTATDCSSGPPLATEALVGRLLAAASRYGLEFPPPA